MKRYRVTYKRPTGQIESLTVDALSEQLAALMARDLLRARGKKGNIIGIKLA